MHRRGVGAPKGRWRSRAVLAALGAALAVRPAPVSAQEAAPASGAERAPAATSAEPSPDSPRACLAEYLALARQGRYPEAARHLAVPDAERQRAPVLAERLKAVLDRHLWVDLDLVSGLPSGDTGDGLPAGTERIGSVPGASGALEPVLLVLRDHGDGPQWVFSSGTVSRVDAWYEALDDRWVRERLPAALLLPGPREMLWYQWLALPLLVAAAWAVGRLLGLAMLALGARVVARTKPDWDDALLTCLRGPAIGACTLTVAFLLLPSLHLNAPGQRFLSGLLRAGGLLVVFWALWRCVDLAVTILSGSRWGMLGSSTRALVQVGQRLAKAILLALGLLAVLAELGYPVAGLVAGLGIGGLALALAAQKTVENLFGSLALALDRPFGVGDFVRVEDLVGTVEVIGLRSTQIRSLNRTLITIPNGRLADMRLESFSARDRMRLSCIIGLVYDTTPAQMRRVLEGLEGALRSHPRIWPDAVVVRFKELGASSLDIEVMAWFETAEWSEFQLIRQEALLRFMEVVEQAGASFAFPTRTVHLVAEDGARPADAS